MSIYANQSQSHARFGVSESTLSQTSDEKDEEVLDIFELYVNIYFLLGDELFKYNIPSDIEFFDVENGKELPIKSIFERVNVKIQEKENLTTVCAYVITSDYMSLINGNFYEEKVQYGVIYYKLTRSHLRISKQLRTFVKFRTDRMNIYFLAKHSLSIYNVPFIVDFFIEMDDNVVHIIETSAKKLNIKGYGKVDVFEVTEEYLRRIEEDMVMESIQYTRKQFEKPFLRGWRQIRSNEERSASFVNGNPGWRYCNVNTRQDKIKMLQNIEYSI